MSRNRSTLHRSGIAALAVAGIGTVLALRSGGDPEVIARDPFEARARGRVEEESSIEPQAAIDHGRDTVAREVVDEADSVASGVILTGVVYDDVLRKPQPRVEVRICHDRSKVPQRRVYTNAKGEYRFETLEPDKGYDVDIFVAKSHRYHGDVPRLRPGTTRFDIHMPEGESFRGRIVDSETGAPVGGVRIEFTSDQINGMVVGTSEADGVFVARGVFPSGGVIQAQTTRSPAYFESTLNIAESDWRGVLVNVPLTAIGAVEFRLLESSGLPVQFVDVDLCSLHSRVPEGEVLPECTRHASKSFGSPEVLSTGSRATSVETATHFRVEGLIHGQKSCLEIHYSTKRTSEGARRILESKRGGRFLPAGSELHTSLPQLTHCGEVLRTDIVLPSEATRIVGTISCEGSPSHLRASWKGKSFSGSAPVIDGLTFALERVEAGKVLVEVSDSESKAIATAELTVIADREHHCELKLANPKR